jgi:hypothetical protein
MSKFNDLAESRRKAEQVLSGTKSKEKSPEHVALDMFHEANAAKTARLRAARLAKEAADRAAAPPVPAAARRKSPR